MPELVIESLAYGGDGAAHLPDGAAGWCRWPARETGWTPEGARTTAASLAPSWRCGPLAEPRVCGMRPAVLRRVRRMCVGSTSRQVRSFQRSEQIVDSLARVGGIAGARQLVGVRLASPRAYTTHKEAEIVGAYGPRRPSARIPQGRQRRDRTSRHVHGDAVQVPQGSQGYLWRAAQL